jgi:hypothetical protein
MLATSILEPRTSQFDRDCRRQVNGLEDSSRAVLEIAPITADVDRRLSGSKRSSKFREAFSRVRIDTRLCRDRGESTASSIGSDLPKRNALLSNSTTGQLVESVEETLIKPALE